MGTTKEEIRVWFDSGVKQGAEFMLVVCDTFDHGDYPVYVKDENVQAVFTEFSNKSMQRVHEVYSLKLSREYQLNEGRAFHLTHDAGKDGQHTVIALAVPDEVLDKLIAKEEAMLEKLRGDKPTLRERLVEMHKRGDLSTLEGKDVVDSFLEILHQKLSILRELKERRAKA